MGTLPPNGRSIHFLTLLYMVHLARDKSGDEYLDAPGIMAMVMVGRLERRANQSAHVASEVSSPDSRVSPYPWLS